jgi:hypothetical protein
MSKKIDHTTMDSYVNGKLVKKGAKDEEETKSQAFHWWKASDESMAQEILGTIKFIQTHQSTRIEQLTTSTRLYGNSSAYNFIGPALSRSASSSANSQSNRISFNLCAAVVDTLVSKIAKNRVICTFLTSGGVWGMQRKAENLSKFTEGCFYAQDVHKKGVDAFRDGAVWGTGVVHVFEDEDEIRVERVLSHELLVDQIESLTSKPRQMHRIKLVDRDVLAAMFADDKDALEAIACAKPSSYIEVGGAATAADILTVTESWHLRSSKTSDDGKHAICLNDTVLLVEDYERDYFPFCFFHFNKRMLGFWGQGAVERLQNLQGEINRLMILIQRSMWMGGSFKILVANGSKVVSQHLNNDVGAIIHYSGVKPEYITPPMIQQDIYPYVDALIAKGFQQEGVSQLAASSLVPLGVKSGAAMRNLDQIGDDRFLYIGQEMEAFYLEIARQMIDVAKGIASRKRSYKVKFPGTMSFEEIDWKDIKLKEDDYVLRAYPTNSLPDDPAGRLQTVQEYAQAGFISPRQARRLMAMPDIEMADKLSNSTEDVLHKIIEDMLDKGEYRAPEPYYDLATAKELGLQYYSYAELNNCPEDKLELLRRFLSQVDDLTGANAAPVAQPAAPPANPEPTPTSNMIPNVNGNNQ